MHPALSIILFTTLSGLGLGMFAWMGLAALPEAVQLLSTVVAFVLTSIGLAASTFHLGHPERVWRALSQWRSSWLSREGVMAIVTLGLVALWWYTEYPRWLGLLVSVGAFLTVLATSMIYAQMRSVRQWNTNLTPTVFVFLSLAGGGLIYALFAAFADGIGKNYGVVVGLILIVAWVAKAHWWRRADSDIEISGAASATGLGDRGQVRMFESPHSGSNYLLSEMGFRVGRRHARILRRIALIFGAALPLLGLALSLRFDGIAIALLVASILAHVIGVLAERWLFFAEARHAVMSYYD